MGTKMNRYFLCLILPVLAAAPACAQIKQGGSLGDSRSLHFADVVTKVESTFEPRTAKRGETVTWRLRVELIPGWHTYPIKQTDPSEEAQNQVTIITFPKGKDFIFVGEFKDPPGALVKPEPELKIKELRSYENSVVWERKLVVAPNAPPGDQTITVPVKLFACKESCLPPQTIKTEGKLTVTDAPPVEVDPKYADAVKAASGAPEPPPSPPPQSANSSRESPAPVALTGDYAAKLNAVADQLVFASGMATQTNTGLSSFLLTAVIWGLVSLVTPCVFPMIPITVSYFLKQSEKTHINPLTQALIYCGTIVVVLGIAALTLLRVFRDMSVNPWTNVVLGGLFVVLALSLFGMFELTLPHSLTRFTSAREGKGGVIGTVFMALTFTIVSFTCVAPFLGGFAGIATTDQFRWYELALGAFAFSAAFAAPFFVLALFPSLLRKLPRSGGWLNSVKVVMGFLELAAALVFFRTAELRLLPAPVLFTYDFVLGLWVALALVCGLYLLNLFRLGHDEVQESIGAVRMLWGFLFVGLAFYMLPAAFRGGPESERQRPSGAIFAWIDAFLLPEQAPSRGELAWSVDLPQAVAKAREQRRRPGQPQFVFVDFTGVTCKNCKYNERAVFTVPAVRDLFKSYALVQMYTDTVPLTFYSTNPGDSQRDAEAAANLGFQARIFRNEQLPLYVILEPLPDGKVAVVDVYDEGKINRVDEFVKFLQKPLATDMARADAAR
jgi:thiol:disulfide interchange protein DsbD